jgi:hypothetical protein
MVPRGTPGFRVEKVIDKMGHRLCQNNSLVFENVRVPEENVISGTKGNGGFCGSISYSGGRYRYRLDRISRRRPWRPPPSTAAVRHLTAAPAWRRVA